MIFNENILNECYASKDNKKRNYKIDFALFLNNSYLYIKSYFE